MAVTFISYGYDTLPGAGLTETVWQDMFPVIGLASYGVRSPADWKVTAVTGADRTVSIAAGRGFGLGVIDKTVENDTIQLAAITSGSRWDLIAVRRDPTPSAGVSKFVAVAGGATPVIPGGRLAGPGIHDQPLALVQVTSGQTQPTGFIDLRTWAGDGGGLIANHDLVRSYLNQTGTRLWINGVDWVRRVGDNDIPEWKNLTFKSGVAYTPIWTGVADFGTGGSLAGTYWVDGDRVHVKSKALFGSNATIGNSVVKCPLPPGYPMAPGVFHLGAGNYVSSTGSIRVLTVFADAGSASVWIASDPIKTPGDVPVSAAAGSYFDIDFTYQTTTA